MFSNAVKIMIYILDVQCYVPIKKLFKTAGSIHLLKITGMLKPENVKLNVKLNLGYFRNILEGGQHDSYSSKVNLPKNVMIKFRDKFKIRPMMKTEPLLFHIVLNQGFTWFTLASNIQETIKQ